MQSAGHEPQHHSRLKVQPLRIIDHTQQRSIRRRVREQREHPQGDQEPIRRRAGHQPEGELQRIALRRRQPLDQPGNRSKSRCTAA